MRLTKRVIKALTGPKDQFQIRAECGHQYRVQDVFSVLINLENQGVVFQNKGMWQKVPCAVFEAWPEPKPLINSVFALA